MEAKKSSGQKFDCSSEVYMGFFPSFIIESFIGGLPPPRGGVTGRELFSDGVLAFFSDGFRI
jgi:hypothetical protein